MGSKNFDGYGSIKTDIAGAVHGSLTARTAEKVGGEVGCLCLDLEWGFSSLTWSFLEKLLWLP